MGDSSVDEDGGGVDGGAFRGALPRPAACRNERLLSPDLGFAMAAWKQQDGPEPTHDDGSPFEFFPPAPVVLFCKSSPPLKKVLMQSQPISLKLASKSKASPGPAAPRASTKARTTVRKVAVRKTLKHRSPSPDQESLHTDDTSSGGVEEVLMPSAILGPVIPEGAVGKVANLAKSPAETREPIASSSAVPLVSGEGCGLLGLLTFDPESIEPAPSTACDEPQPGDVLRQFQHLKALLSSPIETLVEDPEEVKSVLEEIQHHLPVTLQTNVGSMRKAALDAKTDTSVSTAKLETLRKELEDLEERVRATKQLIHDKEALIARPQEEAEGLKAQLKTDLAEIRALNKQLVTDNDEDDEAEIAEVDRVRANALRAFEAFLQ
ncbi:hypothetical protein QYE76_058314 [Lolium multiflorum]|uniref:Uncharacterized protein n=1 Tax=Lolium multiflorum TaxID=4521 RepID=A0AAD8T6V6_LOLMU|nr:hypothetical protein QYE76_058314 [Lolium multiflorum]